MCLRFRFGSILLHYFKWFWKFSLAKKGRCVSAEIEALSGSLKKIPSVRNRQELEERERERKPVFAELLMDLIHYVVSHAAAE